MKPSSRSKSRRRQSSALLSLALISPFLGVALGWGKPSDLPKVAEAVADRFPDVGEVTPAALEQELDRPADARPILLDVRSPEEYAVSHLAGAVRAATLDGALAALDGTPPDAEIVVYCAVGFRSAVLAEKLQKAGYTHVRNLRGALFAWANSGRPVVRDGHPVDQVHPYDKNWGKLLREDLRAEVPTTDQPSKPAS